MSMSFRKRRKNRPINPRDPTDKLPLETLTLVASLLPMKKISEIRRVSTQWFDYMASDDVLNDLLKRHGGDETPGTPREQAQRLWNRYIGRPARIRSLDLQYKFKGGNPPEKFVINGEHIAYLVKRGAKHQLVLRYIGTPKIIIQKMLYEVNLKGKSPVVLLTAELIGVATTEEVWYCERGQEHLRELPLKQEVLGGRIAAYGSILAVAVMLNGAIGAVWMYNVKDKSESTISLDKSFGSPLAGVGRLHYGFTFDEESMTFFSVLKSLDSHSVRDVARYTRNGDLQFETSTGDEVTQVFNRAEAYSTVEICSSGVKDRYHIIFRAWDETSSIIVDVNERPLESKNISRMMVWKNRSYSYATKAENGVWSGIMVGRYGDDQRHIAHIVEVRRESPALLDKPKRPHCMGVSDRFVVWIVSVNNQAEMQVFDFQGISSRDSRFEGSNRWFWLNLEDRTGRPSQVNEYE